MDIHPSVDEEEASRTKKIWEMEGSNQAYSNYGLDWVHSSESLRGWVLILVFYDG